MSSAITIRRATPADTDVVARIVFDAFGGIARAHNFPLDFPVPEATLGIAGMLLNGPKFFGVIAEADGKVIGSNFLDQRDAIATVGPITVDPASQHRGVGRRLMRVVIDQGRTDRHPGIRLVQDAFNTTSLSLYASLGFDVKEPLALVQGRPAGAASINGQVAPVTAADIADCAALCRAVHGFDRAGELRDAIELFSPKLLRRGGRVVAYASAPHFWFVNHGVAETEGDLCELLLGIADAEERPLAMLAPTRRTGFFRWCLSHGLRVIKPMTLIAMGEYHEPRGAYYPSVAC